MNSPPITTPSRTRSGLTASTAVPAVPLSRPRPFARPGTTGSRVAGESIGRTVGDVAHRHPAVVAMARLGWVAKGIVYGLVGVLAVPIAFEGLRADRVRDGVGEASPLGAVAAVAETSLGAIALWIVAVGLALYVVWRLLSIVLPAENTVATWFIRAGYAVSAGMYSFLAWSAMSFATGAASRAETEDAKVERLTRAVDGHVGWAVARWSIGVCLLGVGVYFVVKGVRGASMTISNPVASARSALRRSSRSAVSDGSDGASW